MTPKSDAERRDGSRRDDGPVTSTAHVKIGRPKEKMSGRRRRALRRQLKISFNAYMSHGRQNTCRWKSDAERRDAYNRFAHSSFHI
jgi:hypothetical protein